MYRHLTACRICESQDLTEILDLGVQCLTGVFPKSRDEVVAQGPLKLVKCGTCHLVQLGQSYQLDLLYGANYGYRSGLNQSMVQHLHGTVARILRGVEVGAGDVVLDIGSNDSTLLQAYPPGGIDLVGMDPTGTKFRRFYPAHIQLISDFFSAEAFLRHMGGRRAKIITSIAMFYDLERPALFMQQIAEVLRRDGVWVFEQSYLPSMLKTVSYDTVCHEHLEYYALRQLKFLADRVGLKILDIQFSDVNGGSFSVTAARRDSSAPEATALIERILTAESRLGLATLKPFDEFRRHTLEHRAQVVQFFEQARDDKKKVFGYGASTKGNVMLQYCGVTRRDIACIAEVNEDKFGSYTPGTRIPIVAESEARAARPDFFFVLPWHFRRGIVAREAAYLSSGGRLVFPLPQFEVVAKGMG